MPLVERGLEVIAIEPAPAMAAVARKKLGGRAEVMVGRFEDWPMMDRVQADVALAAELLPSGGSLALVWTEVVSWARTNSKIG